jgi:hydrogenase expression/formation protein HypE
VRGSLAVHGTLNDVAMMGARPLYLTAGFVLDVGSPTTCSTGA